MDDRGMPPTSGMDPGPVSVQPVVARVSIRALDEGRSLPPDLDDPELAALLDDDPSGAVAAGQSGFAVPWANIFPPIAEIARRLPSATAEALLAAAAIWMISQNEPLSATGGVVV